MTAAHRRLAAWIIAYAVLPGVAAAQDATLVVADGVRPGSERLRSLFPQRAEVHLTPADADGLARLELTAEVLSEVRSDLSDLRLLDSGGREIPFLVDPGLAQDTELREERRLPARVLEARRETLRPETGPSVYREIYDLAPPAGAVPEGGWELVLEGLPPTFVRAVRLEQVPRGAGGAAGNGEDGEDGSVFRLGGGEARERTRLSLPELTGERWRLTLEGEGEGFLAPTFFYETSSTVVTGDPLRVALEIQSQTSDAGTTTLVVERPPGLHSEVLRLDTSTRAFRRPVTVRDEGTGATGGALGRGVVSRLPGASGPQALEIPLSAAVGDRLRIEIADGDSPPLEAPRVWAVVRRPALLFAPPATATGDTVASLYFGGGRARSPRYDLAAFEPWLERRVVGSQAEAVKTLVDRGRLLRARLGAPTPNPVFDATPALAFAMRPAAPVDARLYRWRRSVHAEPSPEGLVRLRLTPEDVARARPDLADLRLVDGEGRQWPYLLDRGAAAERLVLPVASVRTEAGSTRYQLELPVTPIRLSHLEVDPAEPFFDRAAQLVGRRAGTSRDETLVRTQLQRRADAAVADPPPVPLGGLGSGALETLALEIEDGDDAPLGFDAVTAKVPLPALSFVAPAGDYALLLGAEGESAPRYELARASDLVLSVAAGSAKTGHLTANPDYSATAHLGRGSGPRRVILWLVLGLAVVVLVALNLRLVRDPKPDPATESAADDDA